VSFDGGVQSTSISTSMDKEYYRQVPYRFFTNESNTDSCKLEKLTNLFPDMKATIELGIFILLSNKKKLHFLFFFHPRTI
jgi:hypothetical protein